MRKMPFTMLRDALRARMALLLNRYWAHCRCGPMEEGWRASFVPDSSLSGADTANKAWNGRMTIGIPSLRRGRYAFVKRHEVRAL